MKTILHELTILPGVMGACIIMKETGVVESNMPAIFTEAMAKEAGANMSRMMQMAKIKGLAPQTLSIAYNLYSILVLNVGDCGQLIILCEHGINTSLAATTGLMLTPEFEKICTQRVQKQEITPQITQVQKDEEAYINSRTTKALEQIRDALFETIGPVADMIYEECIERWTAENPPDIARIFELIGCLSGEIDNQDLFSEFKEKITSLL